jgi:predicted acylesterase/phospholipase RssA
MGYSIGAVNGSAVAFGRLPEALARWRALGADALKLSPRLSPFSLCSIEPLRAFLDAARDEEAAKAALLAELTIIAACPAEGAPINARFTPGGRGGWDGPLIEHAAASCAIPLVFPPVDLEYRGRRRRLIDGGVPMPVPLDFSPLAGCAEVLVVEMVRADEVGRRWGTPWRSLDQRCRDAGRGLVDEGLQALLNSDRPPRVHRLEPSRRLEPMMLDFRAAGLAAMLAQGTRDAEAFLSGAKLL